MAKGKYKAWLKPEKLEQITNWLANGTDISCAKMMGISKQTFYVWEKEHPAISDAIKKGRELRLPSMENTFYSRAKGGVVVTEEIVEFKGKLKNGEPWDGDVVKRTIRKELPPDPGSLMFYLKNKAGYSSEPVAEVNVDVAPTFVYKPEDV